MRLNKIVSIFICLIILLSIVTIFVACDNPSEGEIIGKEFIEAETIEKEETDRMWAYKTAVYWNNTYIYSYPDRWKIIVQYTDNMSGKIKSKDIYVTEDYYNSVEIGDWFVYDEEFCSYYEPYTKTRK